MSSRRLGSVKNPIILSDDDDMDFEVAGSKAGTGRVGNNRAGGSNADNSRATTNQVDVNRIPTVRIALNRDGTARHVIRQAATSRVVKGAARTKRTSHKRGRKGRPMVDLDQTFVCEVRASTPRTYPTRTSARDAAAMKLFTKINNCIILSILWVI
ncbi:unnamed protein product [Rotaria sp. Silwood1]|nr:unnamed protein product [Rotaria sp. Silwood1]CAF3843768.1 unnamed protein product [Rotaria sp. Silwood1]CAF4818133.1 unnamed protein product [Rotaria sp. Silwood1]